MKKVMYINQPLYSDVLSWMVYDINEKAGTAKAIEVEKKIKPTMIAGGFAGHAINLNEDFRKAPVAPKEGAKEFNIYRNKNGIWGYKTSKVISYLPINAVAENWLEENKNKPGVEINNGYVIVFELTPKGKKKLTFNKLGTLEETCGYYYDYNF